MSNPDIDVITLMNDFAGINIVNNKEAGCCLVGPEYKYIENTERIEELIQTKKELEKQLQETNTELRTLITSAKPTPKPTPKPTSLIGKTESVYSSLFSFGHSTAVKENILKFYYHFFDNKHQIIILDNDNDMELIVP
jgi:hypothetical protein